MLMIFMATSFLGIVQLVFYDRFVQLRSVVQFQPSKEDERTWRLRKEHGNLEISDEDWEDHQKDEVDDKQETIYDNVCSEQDIHVRPLDVSGSVERAVRNVFQLGRNFIPSRQCTQARKKEVDFQSLSERIGRENDRNGCIVYMAQKWHSSYGRNSGAMLKKSLDLLYKNYNERQKLDVLIFHEGDFTHQDEVDLRKDGLRPEIFLIKLDSDSRFWDVPGFLDLSQSKRWNDDSFSVGYRKMCRWYSGLLFDFVEKLGYEYVMRMDEDSFIHSPIEYNMFDFMKTNGYEYAFRVDALEPCCNDHFRNAFLGAYLDRADESDFKDGFLEECCLDKKRRYNNYGYYNNFFATKVSFWRQPKVEQFFRFVDWTGGIFTQRENDLVVQSLSVQMFMPREKVFKFEDWSYEHVSGKHCEWGAVVRGTNDRSEHVKDVMQMFYERNDRVVFDDRGGSRVGMYCDRKNYKAAVEMNFHAIDTRNKKEALVSMQSAPYCLNLATAAEPNFLTVEPKDKFVPAAQLERESGEYRGFAGKLEQRLLKSTKCGMDSENAKALWVDQAECGAGCSLNYLIKPLVYAAQTGQAFLNPRSLWADDNQCKGRHAGRVSCYIREFAPRDKPDRDCQPYSNFRDGDEVWRRVEQDDDGPGHHKSKKADMRLYTGKFGLPTMLKEFEHLGLLWNVAQVTKFVMKPQPWLANHILAERKRIGLEDPDNFPVLGVHIRLGDACTDPMIDVKGRRCDGLEYFIPYVRDMIAKFGYRSVFLTTDSQDVIENITLQHHDITWLYNDKIDRRRYDVFKAEKGKERVTIEGVFWSKRVRQAGFTQFQEMKDFLTDTYLLGVHTQGLVGKFSSNMDRIAAALSVATASSGGTCIKPMLSLDANWCFDFNVQSGIGLANQTFYC